MKAAAETVWNGDIDCHGPAVVMSIVWSEAPTVFNVVQKLAAKHGLVFYETEGASIVNPPGLPSGQPPPLTRTRVTLRIVGKQPRLETTVLFDQLPVARVTLPSRQAAHDLARRVASEKGDLGYKVDDPRANAQAFTLVPVPGFPSGPGIGLFQLMPRSGKPDTGNGAPTRDQPP